MIQLMVVGFLMAGIGFSCSLLSLYISCKLYWDQTKDRSTGNHRDETRRSA